MPSNANNALGGCLGAYIKKKGSIVLHYLKRDGNSAAHSFYGVTVGY